MVYTHTDIGHKRSENQDSTGVAVLDGAVFAVVCDGMGGSNAGSEASSRAVSVITERIQKSYRSDYDDNKIRNLLVAAVKTANAVIYDLASAVPEWRGMGTTSLAPIASGDIQHTVNVGDSRMYRCRGGCIRQLSTDQSLVQMLYEQGRITADEKKTHAQKNVIFPVLGNASEEPQPCITEIIGGVQRGDIIIICSDGLSDYITQGEFEEILALPMRLPRRIAKLAEAAIKNGSPDNVSVVGVSMV